MTDSDLMPIAFDIETSGFDDDAVITVAGFCHTFGEYLVLNTAGSEEFDFGRLTYELEEHSNGELDLDIVTSERELLELIASFTDRLIDGDRHYLTAFNGETWNGGFDLPFCRTRFLHHDIAWPFGDLAYADMMGMVDYFATNGHTDLVGVHKTLMKEKTFDPFEDSEEAVEAFEDGEWLPLLKHNLADIQRTRMLARVAGQYVPKRDFSMKNLQPPNR